MLGTEPRSSTGAASALQLNSFSFWRQGLTQPRLLWINPLPHLWDYKYVPPATVFSFETRSYHVVLAGLELAVSDGLELTEIQVLELKVFTTMPSMNIFIITEINPDNTIAYLSSFQSCLILDVLYTRPFVSVFLDLACLEVHPYCSKHQTESILKCLFLLCLWESGGGLGYLQRPEEGIGSLGAGATVTLWTACCGHRELNSGPFQKVPECSQALSLKSLSPLYASITAAE